MKMLLVFCIVFTANCLKFVNSIEITGSNKNATAVIVNLKDEREAKGFKHKAMSGYLSKIWPNHNEDESLLLLGQVLEDIEKGRGKTHKYKKLTKFMYPLFMGVLIAKIVLIPLILKMLTALSASALVMSKIALITTGFMALKWIFAGVVHDGKDRFEIIYLPTPAPGKPYRSASGSFSLWDDQSWSDSNKQNSIASATASTSTSSQQQKYIPVKLKQQQLPYNVYHRKGVVGQRGGFSDAVNDYEHYYSQHNYNNNHNNNGAGKPFL